MDLYAAALMLIAGVLHASWHAVVKSGKSQITLVGMGLVSSAVLFPCVFFLSIPSLQQFYVIFISVFFHVGYKLFLSVSYGLGEFIKVYPLSRGLVPLCAIPLSYFVLGQFPVISQLLGILIVSLGVLAILKINSTEEIDKKLFLSAVSTSLLVASYSVIDAYGARIDSGWLSFTVWLVLIDSLCFAISVKIMHSDAIFAELCREKNKILLSGILGTGSFLVFIWALSREAAPSVIAFRECSVIFGAFISVFILSEKIDKQILLSALSIGVGLIIIAFVK